MVRQVRVNLPATYSVNRWEMACSEAALMAPRAARRA